MIEKFEPRKSINGTLTLPGDKSISHRSVILASMAKGNSTIYNLSSAEDVASTISCFRQLGVDIYVRDDEWIIKGAGLKGFVPPTAPLYAGNSGTTSRLLSGLLSAQEFNSIITGDESLSRRPMNRVVEPLRKMGAIMETSKKNTLPLKIHPAPSFRNIKYNMTVPSAQVKSSIILAALHLNEKTEIIEFVQTRDHTERMLGLEVINETGGNKILVSKNDYPECGKYQVPSDISTAAFFIIPALLLKGSSLIIKNVSLNPTRTGIIDVLKRMGGKIEILNYNEVMNEPFGDILVQSSDLKNIVIEEDIIPNIIDEIPILSVAGLFAEGEFRISGAEELRIKESDRIRALCENYRILGLDIHEERDGFSLNGNINKNVALFDSFGDHRIAMSFAVLSILMKNGGAVNDFDCVGISNPAFLNQLESISVT